MLQNAYLVAKIGADTAENERNFAKILQLPYGSSAVAALRRLRRLRRRRRLRRLRRRGAHRRGALLLACKQRFNRK